MSSDNLCDCCLERVGAISCVHCSALLCEECDKTVHDIPKFKNHERIHEENVLGICSAHGMRAFVLCEDCKEVCCRLCITEQHSGHSLVKSSNVSEKYSENTKLINALESAKEIGMNMAASIQNSINILGEERQKTLDSIDAVFNTIIEVVEERRAALVEQVALITDKEESELQTLYNDLDTKCSWAEQLLDDFSAQSQSKNDNSTSNGASIVATSAEMEKCFDSLCADVKKILLISQDEITKINFVEEQEQKSKPDSGQSVKITESRLTLMSYLRRQHLALHDISMDKPDGSGTAAKTIDGPAILDIIKSFGYVKVEKQKQVNTNSLQLKVNVSDSSKDKNIDSDNDDKNITESSNSNNNDNDKILSFDDLDKAESITLSWENMPGPIKVFSESQNFMFELESRNRDDDSGEFKEIYSGKELSRTLTCTNKDEFRVNGYINGISDKVCLWSSNIVKMNISSGVWVKSPNCSLEKNDKKVVFSGSKKGFAMGKAKFVKGNIYEWKFKVERSIRIGDGELYLGVVPHGTNPDTSDLSACNGWFFGCYFGALKGSNIASGQKYCSDIKDGKYVNDGDEVGIVLDMKNGEISFKLKDTDLGVAFKGIPTDQPLVPAVFSSSNKNSVELI